MNSNIDVLILVDGCVVFFFVRCPRPTVAECKNTYLDAPSVACFVALEVVVVVGRL